MCGITGYWQQGAATGVEELRRQILRMTSSLRHRGPDSGGAWVSPRLGLALGHRRLAIRDLSPAGHQPMSTLCGRYVLCYNGEIYNSDELREELARQGICFKGTSDTEVLLHGCAVWGVREMVSRILGMFAFAFWDAGAGCLSLVRDRLGVKPLYWGRVGSLVLFGSELKALRAHDGWSVRVDRSALVGLMRHCYIPGPGTIYRGINKLLPGHLLEVHCNGDIRMQCYWNGLEILAQGQKQRFTGSDEEMVEELDLLLRDAVKRRMVSDVPLGAFLSGGIDSSLIVSLMQAQLDVPVRTFSIGFDEVGYNEAPYAKAVAEHLGTRHTEHYMTSRSAWEAIPSMPEIYDEPFADSSQLPTYLLSRITRQDVVVSLSGDGGDELFAGYPRFFHFLEQYKSAQLPVVLPETLRRIIRRLSPAAWDRAARCIPGRFRPADFGLRLHGCADRVGMSAMEYYQRQMSHWQQPTALVLDAEEPRTVFHETSLMARIPDHIERMQYMDAVSYLPDDILVKVDRASMAVGLEVRVPFLDHRVFAFAWQLPHRMRVREGKGKWILRRILSRYIPEHLFERPKMGFGVPIDVWLRGPLKDWAEGLIAPEKLRREGFLNPEMVTNCWDLHQKGEGWHYLLWDVLMFQAWQEVHLRRNHWNYPVYDDMPVQIAQ